LTFCILLSYKPLVLRQEHFVHGTLLLHFILKILSFENPPKGSPQEFIFGLGVLYDFLDKGRSQNQEANGNLKHERG
jgi:hypothetical protein